MAQVLKIVAIGFVAMMIAVLSNKYLQPSSTETMAEYKAKYQALSSQEEVTAEEKAELEALFRKINSKENIKEELIEIVVKHTLFFALFIPLTAWVGRHIKMDQNGVLMTAAVIFAVFIIVGDYVTGAIFATTFSLAGLVFRKQPPAEVEKEQE